MDEKEITGRLIYRDAMMLVIDKPAGLPVHKGFGGGENLEEAFVHLTFGLPRTPALAHRLDKDTSGCLILGRHREALKRLSNLFAHNQIKKTYWAIVIGAPVEKEGRVDIPLIKKEQGKHRWHMKTAVKGEEGSQEAVTDYKVLAEKDGLSWVEFKPQTGRTHQLRVHAAALGCPILGDKFYGGGEDYPLHLHARGVIIPLYPKKEPIVVEAEVSSLMEKFAVFRS